MQMTAPCCVAGVVSRNIQRKPSSLQTSPGLQGHEGAAGGQVPCADSEAVRLLLFRFFGQFCQLSKNKNCCAQHSSKQKRLRYFVLLPEVSTRSLPHISPFATISETGVCRAEAPPLLLRYYRAYHSSLRGYCQLLDISRAANDPSVFTIMEKAPTRELGPSPG